MHKRQQLVLSSFLMLVSVAPIPFFRIPIFAILVWSIGFEYIDRRFLYKLMFIYATIFVLIGFPLELAILETIDSVLITPFVVGNYPMILTWGLWALFFGVSILTQFVIIAFCSYVVWSFTGKWTRRLPNYVSRVKNKYD
mgnify:FL=1